MIKFIDDAIETFLDVIYPQRCIFCDDILQFGDRSGICCHCASELTFIEDGDIKNLSVFKYKGMIRKAVKAFKYGYHPQYAKTFADLMYKKISLYDYSRFDMLIPIPIYYKKQRKRGYNQSELLANELAPKMQIPCVNDALVRTFDTPPQSSLSADERRRNIEGAFSPSSPSAFYDKRVVIVDDIYTTGSTMRECSNCLLKASCAETAFLTLSRSEVFCNSKADKTNIL